MASGFFTLLDDIAALMDDVSVMTKVAAKKTAGILGDDLAVNAEKASGFVSSREIPVLWAITKGSLLNKLIILPVAFVLSAVYAPAIVVILVLGGLYLAYEGAEKIVEFLFHKKEPLTRLTTEIKLTEQEILAVEKEKIKSAVLTDFILSVEIIIIALGTVVGELLTTQIIVVSLIALIATVGVYGVVALLVRMDDLGLYLVQESGQQKSIKRAFGNFLISALPWIIKGLAVVGTIALLLVSGGIFVHHLDFFQPVLTALPAMLKDFIIGLFVGLICLPFVLLFKKTIKTVRKNTQ